MDNKFFITTPIYYVNDAPHIGSAYPTLAADVIARFHKLKKEKTFFLTGTDEHGAKIAQAATSHNQSPKAYADKISEKFKNAWKLLNIDYSRFIRTTDEDHIKTAQSFLEKLYNKGFIDPKPKLYKGLYCIGHERFMQPDELINGLCPDHKTKPIQHSEENYFFKLSKFQSRLTELIESEAVKIRPEKRKNETLGRLKEGLEDISISRAHLTWGIPLPFNPKHTSYVWIEALINYYTYGKPLGIWPADVHIVGKDILWFHAIVWPAMLLAIEEQLPKQIFVHGFFTIDGQKMSKTIGNVITPASIVESFGVDGARYLFLTAFPFGEDGDISLKKFEEKYNADLANGLGNLVSRLTKLIETHKPIYEKSAIDDFSPHVKDAFLRFQLDEALTRIWIQIKTLDRKLNEWEPWKKTGIERASNWIELTSGIRQVAYDLQPFLPETAEKILSQFSGVIIAQEPLFPRI